MSEVRVRMDADRGIGDWVLKPGADLETAPPIETAVIVSLFTDRLAGPDDKLEPGEEDRRGWWATDIDQLPIGSRLWLLRRRAATAETLKLVRDYMREALQWLLDEGLAVVVDVTRVEYAQRGRIAAVIVVERLDGTRETVSVSWAWQGV